jgi:hypothetical protein
MRPHRSAILRLISLLALILLVCLSLLRLQPPDRDFGDFSIVRALDHLKFIAAETRYVGAPHHQATLAYLLDQFQIIGFAVTTQTGPSPRNGDSLTNVIAVHPGTEPDAPAVMLAAHYDSVRAGPGASDDGAAVAALLEVGRHLAAAPHRNDLILLITDGEESGLNGAQLFVAGHPLAGHVGVGLNFEARGTSGPSVMFETSQNNAALIELFAQSSPYPVCNSISAEIYRRLPNDTDFTIFRDGVNGVGGGMIGLNFAYIGDYANYHTQNDDIAHLDLASLRHHGIQALAIARRLLEIDPATLKSNRDSIYFDFLSLGVVRYPQWLAVPIAIVVVSFTMTLLLFGLHQKKIRFGRTMLMVGILGASVAIAMGLGMGIVRWAQGPMLHVNANLNAAGFAALAILVPLLMLWPLRRRMILDAGAAGMIVWSVLAIITAFFMPGGSFLAAFPLIGASAAFALFTFGSSPTIHPLLRAIGAIFCAIPALLLLPPILYLGFLGVTMNAAGSVMATIALSFWLLVLPVLGECNVD